MKLDLESFYFYYVRHCKAPQRDAMFYGLARLAREHPNVDPVKALVTHFSHWIHRHRRYVQALNEAKLPIPHWYSEDEDDKTPEDLDTNAFVLPPVFVSEEDVKTYMEELGIPLPEDFEDEV